MQFAGQRTDLELNKIGEPVNVLIKMTDDILPSVDAILLTGITPQATLADGGTRFIARTIDEKTLRALITPQGGEVIDWKKVPIVRGAAPGEPARKKAK